MMGGVWLASAGCGNGGPPVVVPSASVSERAPGLGVISWSEAGSRIGQRQRVEGPVVSAASRAGAVRLTVGAGASSPQRFVVVIPAAVARTAKGDAAEQYAGRLIRVTGTIVRRDGAATIVVHALDQLTIEQ